MKSTREKGPKSPHEEPFFHSCCGKGPKDLGLKPEDPRLLLTIEEAARLLSISRSQLHKLICAGRLERVYLGPRCVRLRRSDVERLAAEGSSPEEARK